MDFKVWLTTAIAVFVLHHFVTTNAQLQSQTGDGINFNEEMLQYYISTSPLEPCPTEMSPCLTLNQFASNKTYCLSENTSITLILQPGTHHLDSELTVANVSRFSVIGEREGNESIVTIECSERFTFDNVTEVNMRFLVFVGCTENYIQSVGQFILDNCTFNGLGRNGTALNIIETMSVNITSCSFFDTQGSYKQFQYLFISDKFVAGGAIISANSSISMHNSTFERNIAQLGGAIFAEQESELILTECVFNTNGDSITFGSAVFANSDSSVTIEYCTFQNISNRQIIVDESDLLFGTNSIVGALESSILIQGCAYRNNVISDGSFLYCLLSNITLIDTIFEHNDAYGYISVSSNAMFSSTLNVLEIVNCTFTGNNFDRSFVDSYQMQVKILNCTFEINSNTLVNNYFYNFKSILDILESSLVIHGCTFANNSIQYGYIVYGFDSNISLVESVFEHNDAYGLVNTRENSSTLIISVTVLEIHNCIFIYNYNIVSFIVAAYRLMQVKIQHSEFANNQLGEYGSIFYSYECNMILFLRSEFIQNLAGSIISSYYSTNVTASESRFVANQNDIGVINIYSGINFNVCIHDNINDNTFAFNIVKVGAVINTQASTQGSTLISRSSFLANRNEMGTIYVSGKVLHIEQCDFSGNSALFGAVLFAEDSSTTMSEVNVTNNVAYVAGIILVYIGNLTSHDISIVGNRAGSAVVALISCMASFSGKTKYSNNEGSIYAVTSIMTLEGNVNVSNNVPFNNRLIPIEEGGAISTLQSSIEVSGTLFLTNNSAENGGAMYILESTFSMSGNITITNNYAGESGGGIYLYQSRLNIQGECSITDNTARNGGGVYAVSSTVTLEENQRVLYTSRSTSVTFNSNTAMLGGAFFLSTNTKIYALLIGSFVHRINFIENTAEYGGALYIDDQSNPDLCNGSSSTECFFQILALNPGELMNVIELQNEALNFTENSANSTGDTIFGGLLDRCTSNILTPSRSQIYGVNYIQNISNIDDVDSISSHPVRLCFCMDDKPDCSYDPPTIYVMKGHTFNISVVAVDQVNHTLESDVEAFLSSNDGLLGEGQKQQSVTTNCTNLTYNIITPHETEELLLNAVGPCGNAHASQRRVKVEFVNCTCPIGFQPAASVQTNCKCECHSNLTNFVSTENCYPSSGTFKPNENEWISYTNVTESNYNYLIHSQCPYDYCKKEQVTISLSQPYGSNELCDFKRANTLCGACLPGYSVSFGSSQCMKCHGKYWPLVLVGVILLEVIAGIAIVCVLLFFNMTVAMGTINGIIFYANIVYGNASIFFNNLPTPSFPSVFIAWLNLDIGFDVCLYDGIDTFAKTLLQLVIPIYLIILVVAVIIISKYSQRFSNLIGKKDPVATLATLILLSYAKILSTVITMLSLTTLQYPEGIKALWKPDATIEYLKHPKHIVLFFVAIIILLLSGTYTIILTSWQLLVRLPNWRVFSWVHNPKLSFFIGAYHAPYTSKHRYWTGLLLMLRVILFLVSAINSTGSTQEPLVAITVVVGCLLFLDTKNVYRKTYLNIIEMVLLANILSFTAFTWYATDTNDTKLQNAIAHISVSITCILLIFVILFHVFKYTKFNAIIKMTKFPAKLQSIKSHVKKKPPQRHYNVNLELANETRDVNIFELVNTNDNTCPQPQVQPSAQPHGVSHSTIEIPKPKDQSQNNEAIHSVEEPSKN